MNALSNAASKCAGLVLVMTLAAGPAAARGVVVQSGAIDPLWAATPDPVNYPTDYEGTAPNYNDTSPVHNWGFTNEPGPHSYDQAAKTITMANSYSVFNTKILWLRLQWRPDQAGGLPSFQTPGEELNPAKWPSANSPYGVGKPTAAAWDVSPAGSVVLTMMFSFTPQPSSETVSLGAVLGNPAVQPNSIRVQTVCIPAPAGLLTMAGIMALGRRARRG